MFTFFVLSNLLTNCFHKFFILGSKIRISQTFSIIKKDTAVLRRNWYRSDSTSLLLFVSKVSTHKSPTSLFRKQRQPGSPVISPKQNRNVLFTKEKERKKRFLRKRQDK